MSQERVVTCPRCGKDAWVDDDGRRVPVTTADSCVCHEFELPPHWRP
jgi:hypothetical protein